MAQANLASKKGIPALLKKLDFDDKLKKFTSNKTKYVEAKKKKKKKKN